jgi:outer membrane protein assembly factor BamB
VFLAILILPALCILVSSSVFAQTGDHWYTAGANPQRTGWVSTEVRPPFSLKWYRPIEAYIDRKTQIIPAYISSLDIDVVLVTTAKGLYALNTQTGQTVWRYDTDLPLTNSPTVIGNRVYIAGLDKAVRALNLADGSEVWKTTHIDFAPFSAGTLVVENKVLIGNRNGYFYALDTDNGNIIWRYPAGGQASLGPITSSAAYDNEGGQGVVYFASNDMYAYALRTGNGTLLWRSQNKLPGFGFYSYWPVVYNNSVEDMIVFASSHPYKNGTSPGDSSAGSDDFVKYVQWEDVLSNSYGSVGPTSNGGGEWPSGNNVMDMGRVMEYLEDPTADELNQNPNNRDIHKPWRRTTAYLKKSDGSDYRTDYDGDGLLEYPPNLFYGSKSGVQYPPVVNPNTGAIYQNNGYVRNGDIARGQVMGWKPSNNRSNERYMHLRGGDSAIDEPQGVSLGGNMFYRILDGHHSDAFGVASGSFWSYGLNPGGLFNLIPNFPITWNIHPGTIHDLHGHYKGLSSSFNGTYHESGNREAFVPYKGLVFVHKGNYVLAFQNTTTTQAEVPPLSINNVSSQVDVPSETVLKQKLADQMEKIVNAGLLNPGYYNDGIQPNGRRLYSGVYHYFEIPGETLYTLASAYPLLGDFPSLQQRLLSYMQNFYQTYYQNSMVTLIGWSQGAPREWMVYPPEVQTAMNSIGNSLGVLSQNPAHSYPQFNFYALYKYARLVPDQAQSIYTLVKNSGKLIIPPATGLDHTMTPYIYNDYIAGYYGFLGLNDIVGRPAVDNTLRQNVQNSLNNLLTTRANNFSKDTPWWDDTRYIYTTKHNLSRNFLWMVPELGDYLHDNAYGKVSEAVEEYNYVGPYWFIGAYDATVAEGLQAPLHDTVALFQAKARILKEPREELYKYLDAPIFKVGDLYYIQNLIATIEASSDSGTSIDTPTPTPTPIPVPGDANADGTVDGIDYVIWLNNYDKNTSGGSSTGDFNGDGVTDGIDYVIWLNNYY